MINVLLYVKKLFHLECMFSLQDKLDNVMNKEAHSLYTEKFNEYEKQCKICVQKSYDERFKNPANSILKFSEPIPIHDKILD